MKEGLLVSMDSFHTLYGNPTRIPVTLIGLRVDGESEFPELTPPEELMVDKDEAEYPGQVYTFAFLANVLYKGPLAALEQESARRVIPVAVFIDLDFAKS